MMCVLMLFNAGQELSFFDMESVTNIGTRNLRAALYSLCCLKYAKDCNDKLLLKR